MTVDNRPLVTIVVPVYNGERYLGESLESLVAQTYSNIEILLLDDCSTDSTPAIAAGYATRLRYIRQEPNRGIYDNVNEGIKRAQGAMIAAFHADDVYEPDIVAREVDYLLQHPDAGAVFCLDRFIDQEGREYGRLALPPEVSGSRPLEYSVILNALLTYKNRFLRCPGAMVRADVYRDVGVYRQDMFRNMADVDMWLRIAEHSRIGILEEHLFRYRHFHGNDHQRFHHLRTTPDRFFEIMDHHLGSGARRLASTSALTAYEAHRAEDALMRAVSFYIRDELPAARETLASAPMGRLAASARVQRGRLVALNAALHVLCRLPRSERVADAFYQRWHVKVPPSAA